MGASTMEDGDMIYSISTLDWPDWQGAIWFVGYGDLPAWGYCGEMLVFPIGYWG